MAIRILDKAELELIPEKADIELAREIEFHGRRMGRSNQQRSKKLCNF